MLVSQNPIKTEVPHEKGNFFEFVPVPWPEMRQSQRVAGRENSEDSAAFGADLIKAMQDDDPEKEKAVRKRLEERQFDESNFDAETLFAAALVGWSGPKYKGKKCNRENRRLLDGKTMKWAKKFLIELTRQPSEEEEKN